MRVTRILLVALGVALIGVGVVTLFQTLRFDQLVGLAIWLAAAVILHDGVLVPVVTGVLFAFRRAGRALPSQAVGVIEVAFALGAVLSLVVVPEIYAKSLGVANPSVLPSDYGLRFAIVWGVIIVTTIVSVAVLALIQRRRSSSVPA